MKRISILYLTGFILVSLLSACDEKPAPTHSVGTTTSVAKPVSMRPVVAATQTPHTQAPYLRSMLPDTSFGYLRLPNLWGMIGAPKGAMLDKAVASQPYLEATTTIRSGFSETILADAPDEIQQLLRLMFTHSRSPLEVALLMPQAVSPPFPNLLASTLVNFDTLQQFDTFLQQLATHTPEIDLLSPVDTAGSGAITVKNLPVVFHFQARQQRLFAMIGADASAAALEEQVRNLAPRSQHPMFAYEKQLDASGQGLFFWLDPKTALGFLQKAGMTQQATALIVAGVGQMNALCAGMGVSRGKHRIQFLMDMPRVGFRSFIPLINSQMNVNAAGDIDAIVAFNLPAPEDFALIEMAMFSAMPSTDKQEKYQQFRRDMQSKLGFGIHEIFNILGPEMVGIFDEAGEYVALKIRDKEKFRDIVDNVIDYFDIKRETRKLAEKEYHHVVIPSLYALAEKEETRSSDVPRALWRFLAAPTHIYWVEEADYVLFSALPQVLIDRNYIKARTDVRSWLTDTQKIEPSHALFLASKRTANLPRRMYNLNLQFMQYLSDYTGESIDLFALPTAREANLASDGGLSLLVNSSDTQFSFEISYDHNPAEILLASGKGYESIATTGILAAIAIPAYQDYTIRTKITSGLNAVRPLQLQMDETFLGTGRYPAQKNLDALRAQLNASRELYTVTVDADTGVISLVYNIPALDSNNRLDLVPEPNADQLNWRCSTDIERKFLTQQCRD